jgi:hypothetical protein
VSAQKSIFWKKFVVVAGVTKNLRTLGRCEVRRESQRKSGVTAQ